MTHRQIAHDIGITPTALSAFLHGKKTIGVNSAKKIASFLEQPDNWRRFVHISPKEFQDALVSKKDNIRLSMRYQHE